MNTPPDDRSALTRAIELGSLATTIAMEMVVPIVLGYWLDRWLGTKAVFAILGGVLGMTGGLWHLIRLARQMSDKSGKRLKRSSWVLQVKWRDCAGWGLAPGGVGHGRDAVAPGRHGAAGLLA